MSSVTGTSTSLDDWFEAKVLRHEAALTRYLKRAWPNPDDAADLRQEVYVRVYESAARQLPDSPRAFLLTTARNLILDRGRRERSRVDDATSSFFICISDQPEPDFGAKGILMAKALQHSRKVVRGMETVQRIHQAAALGERLSPSIKILDIALLRRHDAH